MGGGGWETTWRRKSSVEKSAGSSSQEKAPPGFFCHVSTSGFSLGIDREDDDLGPNLDAESDVLEECD